MLPRTLSEPYGRAVSHRIDGQNSDGQGVLPKGYSQNERGKGSLPERLSSQGLPAPAARHTPGSFSSVA